ncbi:putative ATP-dependent RNA helicase DHX30-like isoform X5 [Dinothrombium tinctorium]|uniref:Putative ATP-dependent RNA helicase DHX30-like isoform X5 n=1 Tax=Dinothrombium tinctorium TaxID=1965070 RepID=A0A3S3PG41_9ACAR|nr:putative ATP-dependent RNA helicase DHX30-like isoform X5 [Dinothrombium tinctorium]
MFLILNRNHCVLKRFLPAFRGILFVKRTKVYLRNSAAIEIGKFKSELKCELNTFLNEFDSKLAPLINERLANVENQNTNAANVKNESPSDDTGGSPVDEATAGEVLNIFTSKLFVEPSAVQLMRRSKQLIEFLNRRKLRIQIDSEYRNFREKIATLPIYSSKQKIIDTIEKNRVTVIAGETACGKTTQIPLFVFEDFIEKGKGAECSMVITQPRRLPTVAVSEQVAYQFGEKDVGKTVGYQIRFQKVAPQYDNGAILFCTGGMLLRKLANNPNLSGVTHVFIDEVHERDVIVDFLLVLLKRLIRTNENIKIILMSATLNAELFSQFFDGCPLLEIKGRLFPVHNHYLPDIKTALRKNDYKEISMNHPRINKKLIVDLILHIDQTMEDGSILCFLPGWGEICDVKNELENQINRSRNYLNVIPVHSSLPPRQQKRIFEKVGPGMRKVVLSTNIAETSITVPDVVHVIDSGLCKELRYNKQLNVSTFGTNLIAKANAKQREGRAGRVRSGNCFKLYSEEMENQMDDYSEPELLRTPLESVVLQAKFYCPNEKAEDFLSLVPQPPSLIALRAAVSVLKSINVLDENENLTTLGKKIVHFTSHPRLSVCLVYAAMFGCLDSVLNTAAVMSNSRDIFDVTLDERKLLRDIKLSFSQNCWSDHIVLSNIINDFLGSNTLGFCAENRLHEPAVNSALEIKNLFSGHFRDANFLLVEHSNSVHLIKLALICGLYPNVIRLRFGEKIKGKVKQNKIGGFDVNSGKTIRGVSDCVLKWMSEDLNIQKTPNSDNFLSFAVYFHSFYSKETKRLTVKEATLVSPLSLLLFAGSKWNERKQGTISLITVDNNKYLQFKIHKDEFEIIKRWKQAFIHFFKWFITRNNNSNQNVSDEMIMNYLKTYIGLTNNLIEATEQPLTVAIKQNEPMFQSKLCLKQ